MTPCSWPSHRLSFFLKLLDKHPTWRTRLVQTHLPSISSFLLLFFLFSKRSSSFLPSSFLFMSMPAHWSLSVLNVRDTFKDAFRSPLIIHTAWIINNNSHRAIISFTTTTLSLSLSPIPLFLSLSSSCPRPFFPCTPYSLLKLLHPVISLFAYSAHFSSPFMCIISLSFFPWQGTFWRGQSVLLHWWII